MTEPTRERSRKPHMRCPLCQHTTKVHTEKGDGCAYCKCTRIWKGDDRVR